MQASNDTVTFAVKVIPRSRQDQIVGVEGDALKVRVKAPPVEGKANDALVRFLASLLGISREKVEIVRGATTRQKVVKVRGVAEDTLRKLLNV